MNKSKRDERRRYYRPEPPAHEFRVKKTFVAFGGTTWAVYGTLATKLSRDEVIERIRKGVMRPSTCNPSPFGHKVTWDACPKPESPWRPLAGTFGLVRVDQMLQAITPKEPQAQREAAGSTAVSQDLSLLLERPEEEELTVATKRRTRVLAPRKNPHPEHMEDLEPVVTPWLAGW